MTVSPRRLWLIGIAAFLIFAIARIPAGLVGGLVGEGPVMLSGISGTLWHGEARQFAVAPLRFGAVRWSWKPAGLFRGRLEFDVESEGNGPRFNGIIGAGLLGALSARAFTLLLGLEDLGVQFNTTGRIRIDIESMSMREQWPDRAAGQIVVENLTIDVPSLQSNDAETMNFGDFEGDFTIAEGGPLTALFRDRDGPLEIIGTMTLDAAGNYEINGDLKPRGRLGTRLQNMLQYVPRSAEGSYALGFSGRL